MAVADCRKQTTKPRGSRRRPGMQPVGVFFSSRRRHTRFDCDWSSDVCSSDLSLLSEYALNSTKVFKLRAKRDQSCDESLLQMTWPEGDPHPGSQYSADSPGLSASDRNNMLPCYRTTADDYRKAISRGR